MALSEVALPIQFAGGVETKMDRKAVPTTKLTALENAIFSRAVSLVKRNGYESLGTSVLGSSTPYALPRGLASRGDELVLFTESAAYSYVEGAAAWNQIGDGLLSVRQTDRALVKTVSSQTGADYAACSGVALIGWIDSRGGIWYAVTETGGERITIAPTLASATGGAVRCVRVGDSLALLWTEAALGQVKIIVFDPAAPHTYDAAKFPRVLIDDLLTTWPVIDAAYTPPTLNTATSAAAITWMSTAGVRVAWLDRSGYLGSAGIGWPGALTFGTATNLCAGPTIAVSPSDPSTWAVAWGASGSITTIARVASSAATPAVAIAATWGPTEPVDDQMVDRIALAWRGTAASDPIDIWIEQRAAIARDSITRLQEVDATTGSGGAQRDLRGACLASTAWTDQPLGGDGSSFVTLLHSTPLNSVYLAVRHDGLCVAQTIPTNAGIPPGQILPRVVDSTGTRVYEWAALHRARLAVDGAVNTAGVFAESGAHLVSLDFAASDAYQSTYAGRTLYVGGAVVSAYDGVGFVESAPFYAPDWESTETLHSQSTAGVGGMANGTYSYLFWYEATLANGEVIRGPVSKPYAVTVTGSNDRVTISVPTLRTSAWGRSGAARENLRVCAARSLAGDASAYYRITSLNPSTTGLANGYVTNSQFADTVTLIDEYSDATLALQEPHYTTGGVPSNDPIAPSGVLAEGKGRVFFGDASDPSVVYYSQERADSYAIECSPELRLQVPPSGGAVTAIGTLDDAMIIFKRSAIYMVTGPGPLANPAAGGSWDTPALVTSDVGCIDQRSLVTTPTGLMFQSAKGIFQIDRGRQVSYVGAPVEAYNTQRIARATLVEDTTQVRFLTDSGSTLLYDYLFGQWSTFTNHEGIDSATVRGLYHYLRNDGRVFRETPGVYADDQLQIPVVIETAWIRLANVRQGLQRIWHAQILGDWKSAHVLRVQWQTDYDDPGNWSQPVDFDATNMSGTLYGAGAYGDGAYGGDTPSRYQWRAHVGKKCQSIRFRISFPEAVGAAGACAELTELLLTGGVKGNVNKIPAARTG